MANQIERRYLELTDPVNNHYKFYELVLWDDHTVEIKYGRIGAKGVTQVDRHNTSGEAYDLFYRKLDEKKRKGYFPCKDDGELHNTAKAPPAPPEPLPTRDELAASFVELLHEGRGDT